MTELARGSGEEPNKAETDLVLNDGLNAVFGPDLTIPIPSGPTRGYDQKALTSNQVLEKMNKFTRKINEQGGRIINTMSVDVQEDPRSPVSPRTLFIVDKPAK